MSNRYPNTTEGDTIDEELMECAHCGSDNLRVTETNQYEVNTLDRDVRCDDCNARYREEFTIERTVVERIPDVDEN